ncbi:MULTISPECIES: response regulator [Natrialbaceae]|uniref:response regulator n=1 Tax=Natrialbaceae TaxID=1644061 RepID=UPI00207CAB9B|nr:response regulator [Natronococcus sp. CG52]
MTAHGTGFSHRDAQTREILLVEDNPGDVRLLEEAMDEADISHRIHVVSNGRDALEFIRQRGPYEDAPRPDLVLLDLNLPQLSGEEVLDSIKTDADHREIPVIMLTSSATPENVRRAYRLGANAYLTKPVDPSEFVDIARSIEEFWLAAATLPPGH